MDNLNQMSQEDRSDYVDNLSDADVQRIAEASTPGWSSGALVNGKAVDADGFTVPGAGEHASLRKIQKECWAKFHKNPHISSHVIDIQGALTGDGFKTYSDVLALQDAITEIEDDIRNELKLKYPKYIGRTEIEGELFLALTVHTDGFVEVDFMDPSALIGGDDDTGIYFHPKKKSMPLFYEFSISTGNKSDATMIFPSIYIAHMPKLEKSLSKPVKAKLTATKLKQAKNAHKKYKSIGGYRTFIVSWDKSLFMARNTSHIQTTLEWINHYENLKKWEIDHKKSAGSYLWVFEMTDAKSFRTWLKMTDDERKECGITAQKTPGGTIVLPPGIKLTCQNPKLPSISEQDTDIMHMVTSGLNKPEDMVTGQTKGDTFSGVKASRGPQADRVMDMICNWERFLRYTLWRNIFLLKSKVSSFKLEYQVKEAIAFEDKKAKFKKVKKQAHDLLEFEFPMSEVSDIGAIAGALLGSKHPNVVEFLGLSREQIAKKIGFNAYRTSRLKYATEEETYPDLPNAALIEGGAEDAQEVSKDKVEDKVKEKPKTKTEEKPKLKKVTPKKK